MVRTPKEAKEAKEPKELPFAFTALELASSSYWLAR
jgi:hypothetical protein